MANDDPPGAIPPRTSDGWKRWTGIFLLLALLIIAVAMPEQHYGSMSRAVICVIAGVAVALLSDAELGLRLVLTKRALTITFAGGVAGSILITLMKLTAPDEVVAAVEVQDQKGHRVQLTQVDLHIRPDSSAGSVSYGTRENMLFVVFPVAVERMQVELAYWDGETYRGSFSRPARGRLLLVQAIDEGGAHVLKEKRLRR